MSNNIWLSTGGSSGIGKATALAFSANGATVTITGVFQTLKLLSDLYTLRPCCSHVCQKAGWTSFNLDRHLTGRRKERLEAVCSELKEVWFGPEVSCSGTILACHTPQQRDLH